MKFEVKLRKMNKANSLVMTIPQPVVKNFGLLPGTEMDLIIDGEQFILRQATKEAKEE